MRLITSMECIGFDEYLCLALYWDRVNKLFVLTAHPAWYVPESPKSFYGLIFPFIGDEDDKNTSIDEELRSKAGCVAVGLLTWTVHSYRTRSKFHKMSVKPCIIVNKTQCVTTDVIGLTDVFDISSYDTILKIVKKCDPSLSSRLKNAR